MRAIIISLPSSLEGGMEKIVTFKFFSDNSGFLNNNDWHLRTRVKESPFTHFIVHEHAHPGGVLNFELGTDVRPEVSTTTL